MVIAVSSIMAKCTFMSSHKYYYYVCILTYYTISKCVHLGRDDPSVILRGDVARGAHHTSCSGFLGVLLQRKGKTKVTNLSSERQVQ